MLAKVTAERDELRVMLNITTADLYPALKEFGKIVITRSGNGLQQTVPCAVNGCRGIAQYFFCRTHTSPEARSCT